MPDEIVKFEPTNHDLARAIEGLSVNQALAMNCIMSGGTMIAAAQAAGVHRNTLYEWLQSGTPLYEAVALWKQDLATAARTRLLMMTDLATQNILAALQRGDVRTAMTLVQKLGILSAPPTGPTHIEAVTQQVTTRTHEHESDRTSQTHASAFVSQWTEMSETHERRTTIKTSRDSRRTSRKHRTPRPDKSPDRHNPAPQAPDSPQIPPNG